ncbi:hypothetical protein IAQ61_003695 [Plenodomus lingam]|uniref:uncharacterized protein n=1 Tax=Leptosphaeria maculans TaxID=5022 RepID=UPI0033245EBA|nr:hypothetical protein IAQ61_003695 [Plenodomus lingam]
MRNTRQKACCSDAEFHQGSIMMTLEAMVKLSPTISTLAAAAKTNIKWDHLQPPHRREASMIRISGSSANEAMALSRACRVMPPWYCSSSQHTQALATKGPEQPHTCSIFHFSLWQILANILILIKVSKLSPGLGASQLTLLETVCR